MAISDIWTLKTDSLSDEKTLTAWGFSSGSLSRVNQGADELVLQLPQKDAGAISELWAWETPVTLYRDSVVWYRGYVDGLLRQSDPGSDTSTYVVKNVWWLLERAGYLANWTTKATDGPGSTTVPHPRIRLGWDADGELISSRTMLGDVITYAASLGISVSIDTDGLLDSNIPVIETHNVTVAELVRRIMRWHPDGTLRAEYAASGTTLVGMRRETAQAIEFSTTGSPVTFYDIRPRNDLLIDSAHVHYEMEVPETTVVDDGAPETVDNVVIHVDKYPAGASVTRASLVELIPVSRPATIEAGGTPGTTLKHKQPVGTVAFSEYGATDDSAKQWWLEASGLETLGIGLADIKLPTTSTATVFAHRIAIKPSSVPLPPSAINPNSTPLYRTTTMADLPRELVSGALADWMSVYATDVIAEATIAIAKSSVDNLADVDAKNRIIQMSRAGTVPSTGGSSRIPVYLVDGIVETVGTDATTKVYEKAIGYTPADIITQEDADAQNAAAIAAAVKEAVVPKLARVTYDSRSVLQYEGSLRLTAKEAGTQIYLGNSLNLYHASRAEWASMKAQIQQESVNLTTGEIALSFGPAEHLEPQDWIALYAAAREMMRGASANSGAPLDQSGGASPSAAPAENPVVGATITPKKRFYIKPKVVGPKPWDVVIKQSTTAASIQFELHDPILVNSDGSELAIAGLDNLTIAAGDTLMLRLEGPAAPPWEDAEVVVDSTWPGGPDAYYEWQEATPYGLTNSSLPIWRFYDQDGAPEGAVEIIDGEIYGEKMVTDVRRKELYFKLTRVREELAFRLAPYIL